MLCLQHISIQNPKNPFIYLYIFMLKQNGQLYYVDPTCEGRDTIIKVIDFTIE